MDDDDLFATLGGSLMKDLLADLNDDADAGLLSLEQLEKELAHLDSKPTYGSLPTVTEDTPTAASMVVAAQQQGGYGGALLDAGGVDAWSLSLQKFTSTALEQDFLQADSAKKLRQVVPVTPQAPPGLQQLLSKAEEYNVTEAMVVGPPPGMGAPTAAAAPPAAPPSVVEQVAQRLETVDIAAAETPVKPPPPIPKPMPVTPQNSATFNFPKPPPMTPQNSVTVGADGSIVGQQPPMMMMMQQQHGMMPPFGSPPVQRGMPPPTPPNSMLRQAMPPPTPPNSAHTTPHGIGRHMAALTAVPVAVPLNQPWGGGAPMASPPPPMARPRPVYANPHPDAPPIPAAALATAFMTVRDISYVVHALLKPILAIGISPFDYDQVYLRRRGQGLSSKKATHDKFAGEMTKRGEKTKEWSNQHGTLGHSSKTNVARPRALIASPMASESGGGEERQRQTLWKARIYCDQAYQAYLQVVEAWETSSGSAIPSNLQPHLVKLLRCFGISLKDDGENPTYTIDPSALSLLLKLAKGRVLLARLLEQALLPPASVQVLLPCALQVLYESKPDPVDDRIFTAWARVVNSLPELSETCIMTSVGVIQKRADVALHSTNRMETVHALLRRGSMLAASNQDFAPTWSQTEQEFMKILGGM
jgi:hypothetical protein